MDEVTAVPNALEGAAEGAISDDTKRLRALNASIDGDDSENIDAEDVKALAKKAEETAKKEKTPEERERARMQRRIDNLTKKYHATNAELEQYRLRNTEKPATKAADNEEPITLTRAELQKMIEKEAKTMAPTVKAQQAAVEQRQAILKSIEKDWGAEKFNSLAEELDSAFGGLAVNGVPKPATDAIFESENPKAVIEYLADPDNADEAEKLAAMNPVQAGRAIAKLEAKLAVEKPVVSKAAKPIEAVRSTGTQSKSILDSTISDAEWLKRRQAQIQSRRR